MPRRAFTLIELLIVVAIIAILAAIAIPNFAEAQVRAKVSRLLSDASAIKTGLAAYRIDAGRFPETDWGGGVETHGAGMARLTSPIAYLGSIPSSPFLEDRMGLPATDRHFQRQRSMLYRRSWRSNTPPPANEPDRNGNNLDDTYELDRMAYLVDGPVYLLPMTGLETTSPPFGRLFTAADSKGGEWMLKSVGPNDVDDREGPNGDQAGVYTPSNGTISDGDIVFFSDAWPVFPR